MDELYTRGRYRILRCAREGRQTKRTLQISFRRASYFFLPRALLTPSLRRARPDGYALSLGPLSAAQQAARA